MKNPYTLKLEQELADIIRRRVALRKVLEQSSLGMGTGDAFDRRQRVEFAARELRWCQKQYEKLHHELGRPLPLAGSVKIGAPPVRYTGAVRYAAPPARQVLRTVPSSGYITKVMVPR